MLAVPGGYILVPDGYSLLPDGYILRIIFPLGSVPQDCISWFLVVAQHCQNRVDPQFWQVGGFLQNKHVQSYTEQLMTKRIRYDFLYK